MSDIVWGEATVDPDVVMEAVEAGRLVQVSTYPHEPPGWMLASHQDRGSVRHWLRKGCSFRLGGPIP